MRIIVETVLLIILSIAIVAMAVVLVIVLSKNKNNNINDAIYDASKKLNQDTVNSVKLMSDMINQNQVNMAENQKFQLQQMENRLKTFSMENEQKLENIRSTVEKKLTYMQEDNNKQLENIRTTVDEKLQNTLENKLNKSFETVSKQLQQVYKGLGEMQNLAVGVGDLKKVLSNVKTRGILGEIQLSAILKEILSPEQYEENVATKKGSRNVVEFAIKLPADDDSFVYLPIASKFPGDTYATLVDATNNFSDCFRNRLSCLLAEFTDSCRNISGRCEFRCIRINKALKCRSFFCHNLKLAKSVLISFTDPLTTAFLNTPQSNDILKEGNLSSISTFICDVVMLRFLIDNRFCKLCSKQ